jgi:hypothetical protein
LSNDKFVENAPPPAHLFTILFKMVLLTPQDVNVMELTIAALPIAADKNNHFFIETFFPINIL